MAALELGGCHNKAGKQGNLWLLWGAQEFSSRREFRLGWYLGLSLGWIFSCAPDIYVIFLAFLLSMML